MVIGIMIEEKIDFLERFKVLNEKLRKITEEIDNFVREEQGTLNHERNERPGPGFETNETGEKGRLETFLKPARKVSTA